MLLLCAAVLTESLRPPVKQQAASFVLGPNRDRDPRTVRGPSSVRGCAWIEHNEMHPGEMNRATGV